jgi:phosphate-selective porin OprO/OprP
VKNINVINFETSLVAGSFSLQSEYLRLNVKTMFGNETFNALYAQASYFLTGEKRAYKNALNGFGRVKPINNFGDGNMGAFEIAIRYSMAEGMNDDDMNNITAGLNWHLNPSARVMANYVLSSIENNTQFTGKGNFSAFQMRFQIDF